VDLSPREAILMIYARASFAMPVPSTARQSFAADIPVAHAAEVNAPL